MRVRTNPLARETLRVSTVRLCVFALASSLVRLRTFRMAIVVGLGVTRQRSTNVGPGT
jgi:hypothetical protein